MQFSVPQFIDVEDKIVGPFTAKQTLYLVIGGAIILLAFSFFKPAFFVLVSVIVVPITLAFAFWRPKGISVAQLISNFTDFYTTEHLYLWRREPDMTMYKVVQKKQANSEGPEKIVTRSRIRELANLLDTSSAVNMPYEVATRPDENIFR
ncbi:MAG: PrgI family protein [Candidatus Pacebacteria bacterium]|nr:PrgI family protein [Candidatus Paceibacterota bacterium]